MIRTWLGDMLLGLAAGVSMLLVFALWLRDRQAMEAA